MTFAGILLKIYSLSTSLLHYALKYYFKIISFNKANDIKVFKERFGIYGIKDYKDQIDAIRDKTVICFYTANSGEFNAIRNLLQKLDHPSRFFLIMTTNRSGQLAFKNYEHTSDNIFNINLPFDTKQAISSFLSFWQPSSIILVGEDFWPNLIVEGSKRSYIGMINARMPKKTFIRWRRFGFLLRFLLNKMSFIAVNSNSDLKRYKLFYKNPVLTGNLKYDADKLPVSRFELEALKTSIGDRRVLVCSSTHPGEEEILIQAYKKIVQSFPNLLMIIAPRHPERDDEIHSLCLANNILSVRRRHTNSMNNHIPTSAQVYIMNTLGELGLAYSLSNIVFVGGSLVRTGGHNVCEPARFGCAVITGPYTQNFADLISGMKECNGIVEVNSRDELIEAVVDLMRSPLKVASIAENGLKFVETNSGSLNRTIEELKKYSVIRDDH